MRQGNSSEVRAILDTIPELEVVKEYVATPPKGMDNIAYCRQEYESSVVCRFLAQARLGGHGNPLFANDLGSGWQENAQFEVRHDDVPAIVYAADRILTRRSFIDRFSRSAKARNAAAKNILAALDTYSSRTA